jgi:hypothetical protein
VTSENLCLSPQDQVFQISVTSVVKRVSWMCGGGRHMIMGRHDHGGMHKCCRQRQFVLSWIPSTVFIRPRGGIWLRDNNISDTDIRLESVRSRHQIR